MASLFWVGGSTAYDGTTNRLATTSGGAASVAVIASGDTVTFDANSPASAAVTTSAAISCTTLTLNTGFTGSLTMSNTLTVSGTVNLTQGTLNTNGQTCSWGAFASSNSNTRTLTMGSSSIAVSSGAAAWTMATATNLTITANTATITFTGNGAVWNAGNNNYGGASIVITGAGTYSITQVPTVANFTRTGTAIKTDNFTLAGMTITGTFTVTGNSAINRMLLGSSVAGTQRTVTAAAVSLTNVDISDIIGAGAATWTGTSLGDALGNSNITFTTPATQTHTASAGGSWSDVTKWTSRVPLPQDNVIVDVNTTGTLTNDMPRLGANIDFTGFAGTFAMTTTGASYGSYTLASGMTYSGTGVLTLSGRSSHTITTAGKALTNSVFINAPSSTYTLQDAFTDNLGFTLTLGTLTTNNFNMTADSFTFSSGSVANLGTSTLTATRTTTTSFSIAGGSTMNGSTATFVIGTTSASTRTFAGGGKTFGTLTYTVAGSTGGLDITGSNTFGTINFSDVTNARTLRFTAGTTTTITNAFNVNGTSGKLMTIDSITAATHILTKPTGTVSVDYVSIANSIAGVGWYAGANSTDAGGNKGWIFTAAPTNQGNFFLMM